MLSRLYARMLSFALALGPIAFGCAGVSHRQSSAREQTQPPADSPTPTAPAEQPASRAPAVEPPPPAIAPATDRTPPPTPSESAPPLPSPGSTPIASESAPPLPSPGSTPIASESVPPVPPLPSPGTPIASESVPPAPPLPSPGNTPPTSADQLSPEASAARVRALYRQAEASYGKIDSYIARLRRREEVNGRLKPEETMVFRFRKQPWSVYFKWLGETSKGREAIFVKGQHDSKLHTRLAAGDMPFMPAGKCIALDPESILVRSRSRHAITEAGIGYILEKLGAGLRAEDEGRCRVTPLRYLGPVRRPEYTVPLDCIEQTVPPNDEAGPEGGIRKLFFDPATHLPVLLILRDARGRELEYYCYDRLEYPVHLDDDDFNPEKLWKDASEKRR